MNGIFQHLIIREPTSTFEKVLPKVRKVFLEETGLRNSKESRQIGLIGKALAQNGDFNRLGGEQLVIEENVNRWFPFLLTVPKVEADSVYIFAWCLFALFEVRRLPSCINKDKMSIVIETYSCAR